MNRKKVEEARRVTITIVVEQEWHEDDFNGNLQDLRDHSLTNQEIIENLPYMYGSLHDLLETATITSKWENITYWTPGN